MLWRGTPAKSLDVPNIIEIDGQSCVGSTINLTGIHITPANVPAELATACGLLAGRAERRGWIRDDR